VQVGPERGGPPPVSGLDDGEKTQGSSRPGVHDVSEILLAERRRFPEGLQPHLEELASISRSLRRDRELAFYGAEDLTPSGFYRREDARRAMDAARKAASCVEPFVEGSE